MLSLTVQVLFTAGIVICSSLKGVSRASNCLYPFCMLSNRLAFAIVSGILGPPLLNDFHIHLVNQIYQLAKDGEALIERLPVWGNSQRCYSGSLMGTKTLAHHLFCADEIGFEHQFIRDERHCRLALAFQPQILH